MAQAAEVLVSGPVYRAIEPLVAPERVQPRGGGAEEGLVEEALEAAVEGTGRTVVTVLRQPDVLGARTLRALSHGELHGVTFAQVLGWLFKRYHDLTVAVLTGFMLGSLRKVWPWKIDVASAGESAGMNAVLWAAMCGRPFTTFT